MTNLLERGKDYAGTMTFKPEVVVAARGLKEKL